MATVEERHPELFQPVSTESPRGKKRTVPMQVLCLGFNRTGTSSMSAALEKLGMPCWHSFHLLSTHFGDNEMWQEALERKYFGAGEPFGRDEFDQLLHSFAAVSSDTPAIAFAEDLIKAYPEAKVVLVERDIESWYESYMYSIQRNNWHPLNRLLYRLDRSYIYPIGKVQDMCVQGWLRIGSYAEAERVARDRYREHYELVRRVTPRERLLEFKLADGWGPLCEFLGKDVPEGLFPHLNEKAWFDEKVNIMVKRRFASLMYGLVTSPVFVAAVVAVGAWRWARSSG